MLLAALNGNTRPSAWYVGKLPDEKLKIKELGLIDNNKNNDKNYRVGKTL